MTEGVSRESTGLLQRPKDEKEDVLLNINEDPEPPKARGKRPRVVALDAFRGLVIAVMVLVDDAGEAYQVIDHSPWDNITLADFVMPYFLFIVGVAVAITQGWKDGRTPEETQAKAKKVLWRTCKLFVLGLVCQGASFPDHPSQTDLHTLRWCGILQRIAFAYLIVGLVEIYVQPRSPAASSPIRMLLKYPLHLLIPCGFTVLYLILIFGTYVPGCGRGHIDEACNAAGFIDEKILGLSHMYSAPEWTRSVPCSSCSPAFCPRPDAPAWCHKAFDPEGFTTTLGTPLTAALGVYFGRVLKEYKEHKDRLVQWLAASVVLTVLGLIVHFTFMPMNKQMWSLSYVFFMAGTSGFCLSFFYVICDLLQKPFFVMPLVYTGMNAIFIFLMAASDWFEATLKWFWWKDPEHHIFYVIHKYLFESWLDDAPAQLLYVLCKIAFWFVVAWYLHRTGRFYAL